MLGDPSRLGDWCDLFERLIGEEEWSTLLARWWPRLLPGAVASAGHGLIRTGHVVRALGEQETPQRLHELALALGYWAARWQALPAHPMPAGAAGAREALDRVPVIDGSGGIRTRLEEVGARPAGPIASRPCPPPPTRPWFPMPWTHSWTPP